jgi:hypothetical protein
MSRPSSGLKKYASEGVRRLLTEIGFTRPTRRLITEEGILHSHRGENLKYYKLLKTYLIYELFIADVQHICYLS